MTVNHKIFGTGTVISKDAKTVTVNFGGEVKSLMIKYAGLTSEDGSELREEKKQRPAKKKLPKMDYSKLSDAELISMSGDLMQELMEAKAEARRDGKTGTY